MAIVGLLLRCQYVYVNVYDMHVRTDSKDTRSYGGYICERISVCRVDANQIILCVLLMGWNRLASSCQCS